MHYKLINTLGSLAVGLSSLCVTPFALADSVPEAPSLSAEYQPISDQQYESSKKEPIPAKKKPASKKTSAAKHKPTMKNTIEYNRYTDVIDDEAPVLADGTRDYSNGGVIVPESFEVLEKDTPTTTQDSPGPKIVKKIRDGASTDSGTPIFMMSELGTQIVGSSETMTAILKLIEAQIGTPYVWGGAQPGGFDCSGLLQWSFAQHGITIPRVAVDQLNAGMPVSMSDIQPGDLVGYDSGEHIAIYIGDGQVIHAPQPGESVKVSPVDMMPVWKIARYS